MTTAPDAAEARLDADARVLADGAAAEAQSDTADADARVLADGPAAEERLADADARVSANGPASGARLAADADAYVPADGPAAEVQVIIDGPVAHVRLHRPERLNALKESTFRELRDALRRVGDDDACRAVVLSGAGRAFSAGLDIGAGLGPDIPTIMGVLRLGVDTITLLRDIPQPVIAAVGGHAVGAGFALAAACDIRLASADAVFAAPFVTIGMSAGDLGLSWLLPRQIGVSAAARLFYTAGNLGADEALRLGLVSEIPGSTEETVAAALELAAAIARQPALGVRETKSVLNSSVYGVGFRAHLEQELRAQALCWNAGGAEISRARFAARKG